MVGKTAAERKAAERDRKRAEGRYRFDEWLTMREYKAVVALLKRLRRTDNQGTKP